MCFNHSTRYLAAAATSAAVSSATASSRPTHSLPSWYCHTAAPAGTAPAVAKKANWAVDWMSRERSFYERLVGFAAVEGILHAGVFELSLHF